MELLVILAIIGMEIAVIRSEYLPPPQLSSITPSSVHVGQIAEVQCTAPTNYPECFFYLFSPVSGKIVQRLPNLESMESVIFTLQDLPTRGTVAYVCKYQCRVGDESQASDVSNVLSLTIIDEPGPTNSSKSPDTVYVPVWAIALIGGLAVFIILVASVYVTVYLVRRSKQKKQEQRDKESIWNDKNMPKDWCNSHHNYVFSLHQNSTSEVDLSYPEMSCKDSLAESQPAVPFSSFRTLPYSYPSSK